MEIGLPNKDQRIDILNINMAHLQSNNLMSDDDDITELADITVDLTGAAIESLVQSATILRMTEGGDGNVSTADFLLAMNSDVQLPPGED